MHCVTKPSNWLYFGFVSCSLAGCSVDASGLEDALFGPGQDGGAPSAVVERDASGTQSLPISPPVKTGDDEDAAPASDADVPDVALALDASGSVDPCDRDGDGHRAATPQCGGDDCCDDDGRAYPGEEAYITSPDACGSFDYDCNETIEPQYPVAVCHVAFLSCAGDGFAAQTACGETAPYETCAAAFTCAGVSSTNTQGCR